MTDTYPPNPQYPQAPPTSPWSPAEDPYAAYSTHSGQPPYATQDPYGYQPYATPTRYGTDGFPTTKPSAYWPLSVVGFLFSFILGGIALYFSAQVGKRWDRGDPAGARKASRTALILSIVGIVAGLLGAIYLVRSGSSSTL